VCISELWPGSVAASTHADMRVCVTKPHSNGVPGGFTPAACTSRLMQKTKNESEQWKQQLVGMA
jgi:hypothetical protein